MSNNPRPAERRLVIDAVRKSFGPTAALAGVSLEADRGEVHAIIGENGAGKSTLMGILGGAIEPDEGAILLDGIPYRPRAPRDARAAGVAMVHQELSLCPHLTVAENIVLGSEPARFGVLRPKSAREIAERVLERVVGRPATGRLRADARVHDLSPADRQLVEIARALAAENIRLLILDEPTSSLSSDDSARLFVLLRKLVADGLTVLYISHFLEELTGLATSFSVLRDGQTVGRGKMEGTTLAAIVEMMAGRKIDELFPRSPRSPGEVVLDVASLGGVEKPKDASLTLRRGEILGIAGLVGAGRTELLRAIFGLDRVRTGTVRVGAYAGPASPSRRLSQGVGLLSEDRKNEGLALSLSIADNVTLSKMGGFVVPPRRARDAATKWMRALGIRASDPGQLVRDLSGGNQQKVALARLLHHDVDVFLLDEPTRGIDVSSKAQIYAVVDRLAASGKAVLIVSSYLPELFGVCDRIAVMARGKLGVARPVAEWDERAILREAMGA